MAGSAWTNQLINLLILTASQSGFSGFFVYSPAPGAGNLIGSWAAAAGTDPYGNAYPANLQIGNSTAPAQVLITQSGSGQAAEIMFPMPGQALSNVPNIAGGVVAGGPLTAFELSGPAVSAVPDWVQIVAYSNDEIGDEANMSFRYIDTGSGVHLIAGYNGAGWQFLAPILFNGVTLYDGSTMTVAQHLVVGDGVTSSCTFSPLMATPPNAAQVAAGTATLAQLTAFCNGMYQSMKNRGMFN
jgi:hypothetical protein